jgi:FixJ family two-component response regulator
MDTPHAGGRASLGCILVVEDEPHFSAACVRQMRRLGWESRLATSVYAGLTALHHQHQGLVVDLGLPDGSGFEVVDELRRRDRDTPVLIWTGKYFDAESTNRAAQLNVTYAHKPTTSSVIESFLERCKRPPKPAQLRDVVGDFARAHGLTRAHAHVVYAAASGSASRDAIAKWLGVCPETVKSQVSEILLRVNAPSLEQAVAPLRAKVLRDF